MLAKAIEWSVIETGVKTKGIKHEMKRTECDDFDQYDALVLAAEQHPNPVTLLVILLGGEGGDAGREMLGLRWSDVDFRAGKIHIARSITNGVEGLPKDGGWRSPLGSWKRCPHSSLTERG